MKLRVGMVALTILVASCGSSSARSGTSPGARPQVAKCGPLDAPTLAAGPQARVYEVHGVAYGCAVPGGRSFRLGTLANFARSRVDHVALGGRIVAYGLMSRGVDSVRTAVVVRRLSDGTEMGRYAATNSFLAESFQSIGSLVVARDGAVAWIATQSSIAARGRTIEVFRARPPAAQATLLDSGVAINPASLRLTGSALSWRHGSAVGHATLS